ncbi:MAG: methyl-accepting chemotaxis protein [Acidaminococcales bacterium]|nr:methyl-accepting chemotaxis protein [Acidaminococcales bacterium]
MKFHFSLYKKIILTNLLCYLAISFALINAYSYSADKAISIFSGVVNRSAPLVFESKDLRQELREQDMLLARYALYKNPDFIKAYEESVGKSEKLMASLSKRLITPEGKQMCIDLEKQLKAYRSLHGEYIRAAGSGAGIPPALRQQMLAAYAATEKQVEDYAQFLLDRMALRTRQANENTNQALNYIMFDMILVILLALIITAVFVKRLTRPIGQAVSIADTIAHNDLTGYTIKYAGNDEMGDLARSFENMVKNLRGTITDFMELAGNLAESCREVDANAGHAAESAHNIASLADNMAQMQAKEAALYDQATAEATNMNSAISSIMATIDNIGNISTESDQAAASGRGALDEAEKQMRQINLAMEKSSDRVSVLDGSSKKVGDIINVISSIANQTNLLALNAAIEAARAGEHGRGFAVVAEEVRKLAEQVSSATQETSDIINQIQAETQNAINAMASGSDEVAKGNVVIANTKDRFVNIAKLVGTLKQEIAQVKQKAGQLTENNKRVLSEIDLLKELSGKNVGGTNDISALTEEQSANMEEISTTIRQLADLAEAMRVAVQKFKMA